MARSKPAPRDFAPVFRRLRAILKPYAKSMAIATDSATEYTLEVTGPNGRPIWFACVRTMKNYVSFHLMPIYMNPKLNGALSSNLKKRMQGKACFNFTEVDPALFAELKSLTKAGAECFAKLGYLSS
jgi:hypothetical protein